MSIISSSSRSGEQTDSSDSEVQRSMVIASALTFMLLFFVLQDVWSVRVSTGVTPLTRFRRGNLLRVSPLVFLRLGLFLRACHPLCWSAPESRESLSVNLSECIPCISSFVLPSIESWGYPFLLDCDCPFHFGVFSVDGIFSPESCFDAFFSGVFTRCRWEALEVFFGTISS